jgi:hypothetical protein
MNNFGKNVMGGLFGAFYLMCFAFPVGLFIDVFQKKMPIGQFLVNEIFVFLAAWFICYLVFKGYRELLADANKPRQDDRKLDDNDAGPNGDKNLKSNDATSIDGQPKDKMSDGTKPNGDKNTTPNNGDKQ